MFELLFTTNVPEKLLFKSFGIQHFALILCIFFLIALIARRTGRRDRREQERFLKLCACALPVMYIFRFTVFELLDRLVEPQMSLLDRLPLQLCTMNAVVMPVGIVKKNNTVLNYMYAICLPGAVAAMLTPAMSYYGKYAYFSWQVVFFFLDHGLMALVSVLSVVCGYLRPNIRKAHKVLGVFGLYALCMYPLNKLLDQNFLFLNYPDQGTVMAWFARYLGNPGYLLPMAGLVLLIVFLMYLPWALKDRKSRPAK